MELLKKAIRQALRQFGADVHRYQHTLPFVRSRLFSNLTPDLVLDVGANRGQYARDLRRAGYEGRIVSFEPLPEAFSRLSHAFSSDAQWQGLQLALGEEDGSAMINVAGNSVSSSILEMSDAHLAAAPSSAYVGSLTTDLARLDTLAGHVLGAAKRVFFKLDVQGYELSVLRGAQQTLKEGPICAIESELSIVPCYEGQALLAEVVTYLEGLRFVPVWLEKGLIDPNGYLLQLDGLFIRG
ncbi:MAG: FkbM family methyltransferase [Acidimicrobiia bacterium]